MSRVLHYRHAYVRIFLSQNIVRKETLLKAIYHNNMVLYSELYNLISMVKIIFRKVTSIEHFNTDNLYQKALSSAQW